MSARFPIAVALVTLVLTGCGGDDSSGGSTRSPLDPAAKRAYIVKADRICEAALDDARDVVDRAFRRAGGSGGTPVDVTTKFLIKPGIEVRERQARRLRALAQPAGDDPDLARFLGLFATIDELSHQRLEAGQRGDVDEAMRLERLMQGLALEQQQAAAAFGFQACAKDVVLEALGR